MYQYRSIGYIEASSYPDLDSHILFHILRTRIQFNLEAKLHCLHNLRDVNAAKTNLIHFVDFSTRNSTLINNIVST